MTKQVYSPVSDDDEEDAALFAGAAVKTSKNGRSNDNTQFSPLEVDDDDDDDKNNNNEYDDDDEEDGKEVTTIVTSLTHTSRIHQAITDWLFPPHVPRSCQLLRPENIAVPACYLLVGILQGLSSPLINVFPLDLGATEAQQTTISTIRSLPASFKLVFGFWSDNVPMFGYRRKPYMFLGWFLASLSILSLLVFSNVHDISSRDAGCFQSKEAAAAAASFDNNTTTTTTEGAELAYTHTIPEDAPSIVFLSLCLLGFGTGFWMADVMGDSIVAEKAKLEPPHARGHIQSSCYAYRFFGMMIAAPLSTYLYSAHGPYWILCILSLLPLAILPLVYLFYEPHDIPVASTRDQCHEIWTTVCSRAVWQPMGFVYLYNVLQVGNSAWREFLVTSLHFTSCQLNLLLVCALVLLWLGVLTYKNCLIHWSWRTVYILTTLITGIFSVAQVLLIYGYTFGLSPFWFALGDDAMAEFLGGIQFLPTTIMMVHLCPTGSEGASYAMFTTVNNSALTLSSMLSTMLLRIWDVSKRAFEAGQLSGMVNLTYLTTAIQVSAILFVGWLPHFKEDLYALKQANYGTSKVGGAIFLFIAFGSILYAVSVGVLNIILPGWMGESR